MCASHLRCEIFQLCLATNSIGWHVNVPVPLPRYLSNTMGGKEHLTTGAGNRLFWILSSSTCEKRWRQVGYLGSDGGSRRLSSS
jgi:hypothetical protein